MTPTPEVLVRRWFEEVWNRGNAAAIDQLLSADAKVYGLSPDGKPLIGREAFKPFYQQFRTGFPDLHVTIDQVVREQDLIAVHCHVTGTHTGEMLGKAATHRSVSFTGICIVRAKGDQLVEGWNAFDFLTCFQQIGFNLQ